VDKKIFIIAFIVLLSLGTVSGERIIVKLEKSPLATQSAGIALQELQLFEQDLINVYGMNVQGATTYSYLHLGPGFVYGDIPKDQIDDLLKDERIEYIAEDGKVITFGISLEQVKTQFKFDELIENGYDGEGIKIGVVDTGEPVRKDLNVVKGFDFTGTGTQDAMGHSTAIVSIINALAPKAQVYTYKAIVHGEGRTSTIIRAIEKAVQDKMDIITLQVGGPPTQIDPLKEIVNWGGKQTLLFSSAGNCGEATPDIRCEWVGISSPGNAENAVTIGAINQYGVMAGFSPKGNEALKKPDAYALGTRIQVAGLEQGTIRIVSGNSFSTPIAAAYAANLLSKGINNDLPVAGKKTLFFNGLKDTIPGWDVTTLRGEVCPSKGLGIPIEPIMTSILSIVFNNIVIISLLLVVVLLLGFILVKERNK